MELVPRFDTREAGRALAGTALERPPALREYAGHLWDYWERDMEPSMSAGRTLQRGAQRQARDDHRRLLRDRALDRAEGRARQAASRCWWRATSRSSRRRAPKSSRAAARPTSTPPTSPTWSPSSASLERVLADHRNVDMLVNNAGRSIRRSIALSYDRFHDFERTMQLNYFGAVKLIIGLLPHMRDRGSGHIVNISSIGVQTNPPRFSAYVASKAALDAFTRVVASEVIGDGVTFTTIHMPLVRTPMIAPTKMYDAFPTLTPEEAADMICEALRSRPKHMGTRLGTAGEIAYALSPKAVDRILHLAYRVFPDSAASKGQHAPEEQPPSSRSRWPR